MIFNLFLVCLSVFVMRRQQLLYYIILRVYLLFHSGGQGHGHQTAQHPTLRDDPT